MADVFSIDGHQVVLSDGERERRLIAIRQEGAQLLNLYQSIADRQVRAALLVLVKSMSMMCGKPASRLEFLEREAEADAHRAD